jgi:glycosyltransferase involved in cell wall biosynthesis
MKILFFHPCILPVKAYGGTERFLHWLMRELVRQKHEVTFLGLAGSAVEAEGINFIELIADDENWVRQIPKDTDIVHLFNNYDFSKIPCPAILTVEGNGQYGEHFPLNTVFVSKRHAEIHGSSAFVYNGIDLSEYPFKKRELSWSNFLFLAKASWAVKNLKDCVKVCKKNKKTLHIAGGKHWLPSRYIKNYGMIGQTKKLELLNLCDALLFPVRWEEPFGIAVIEAMALGLPVIGSPYGSLPELIDPRAGFIAKNFDDLNLLVKNPPKQFQAEDIRAYVEEKFSIEVIAKEYLEKYQFILEGKFLNGTSPSRKSAQSPTNLLAF